MCTDNRTRAGPRSQMGDRPTLDRFNDHDAAEVRTFLGPDVEWSTPGAELEGADQAIEFFSALWTAFPDFRATITRVVEQGSACAVQARAQRTHQGTLRTPGGDIPATGRTVDIAYSEDFEVQGGVIVSAWLRFDRLELLEQLGAVPATAAA